MAVKFRAVSTQTNTPGVNQSSVTVTKPTGTADGDILVAVTHGLDTGALSPPAGWVELGVSTVAGLRSVAYKKIAASEGASWTFGLGTSAAIGVSVAAFVGGHDVLAWVNRSTGVTDPADGYDLDAARDAVGWQVYAWRNDTADTTVTWSFGTEKHDITAVGAAAVRRGQSGMYYGPTDLSDIVNAGDQFPSATANPVQTPLFGVMWNFLIGDVEPDNETWSSTNGNFAVDLKLDRVALDSTGGITTQLSADTTGTVSAFTASAETEPASNAADGLGSTNWLDDTTAAPQFLRYDFGASVTKTIRRYRITSAATGSTYSNVLDPMNWTVDGSQNGSSWTTLDTRTNQSFGNRGETREFRITTPGAYRYYRLNVTANLSSAATVGCQLAEFRLSTTDLWEDVTTYVNEEDKIRITRGLQTSSGRSDFSRAYLSFKNTDGRFSLRNAAGAYYGAIQRNTQMRISKAYGTKALQLQGDVRLEGADMVGDCVRAPLTTSLSVTGDIDIRLDIHPKSWRDAQMLAGVAPADGLHSWTFYLDDTGKLNMTWTPSGGSLVTATSTAAVPQSGRLSVRVTVDVDNGASGNTTTFYTCSTFSGSWVQLGDTVVNTAVTSIGYNGGALCVGHVGGQSQRGLHGLVYNFELRTGIAGTLVSDIDFTALTNGAHTFTEDSNNWITVNNAVVSNRRYRFHGEVASWPVAWDPTGNWIYASITGAGVQKRMERGNAALSVMRRYHTKGIISTPGAFERFATPVAYWPIEDLADSFMVASGIPSKPGMQIHGAPDFEGSDGSAFNESGTLPKLNQAKFAGRISGGDSGYADVRFLFYAPTAPTNGANIITLYGTGSIRKWEIDFQSTGLWRILGYNESAIDTGTATVSSTGIPVTTTGELMHVRVTLAQLGADIQATINASDVFGTVLANFASSLYTTQTMGRIGQINVNDDETALLSDAYLGHLAMYGLDSPGFAGAELNAYHYETAGERIQRLCDEEQIEFRHIGAIAESAFMGYQTLDTPFSMMSSAAVSDDGYLIDPLDVFGIEYRTSRSVLNQAAAISLSYTGNELSGEMLPVADDADLVNDFTASRGGAGSARYQRTDGALSVDSPPDGVGAYEGSQSYSLAHEGQCVDIASWQVHKGTVDEERYPKIEVALENLRLAADTALTEDVLRLDVGQRLDITNTPDFLPSEDIRQVVIGYEEWFDNFQHDFKLNTIPERVYEVASYDADDRFASHDSMLYQDVSAAASTLTVVNPTGLPWSDTATDFGVVVDGEHMTVTSIANVTSFYSTDSFNRANSAAIGSTDGGTVSAWTNRINTWGINTNAAFTNAAGNALVTIPGSADFEEVSVTVTTFPATREAWINFRYSDNSNRWRWGGTVGAAPTLQKVVAGAVTSYAADSAFVLAAGQTLTARCHGSVIETFISGEQTFCISDTFNSTATIVGMQTASTDVRFDNFVWIASTPRQTLTVTRGVSPTTAAAHHANAEVVLYKKPYRGL